MVFKNEQCINIVHFQLQKNVVSSCCIKLCCINFYKYLWNILEIKFEKKILYFTIIN